MARKKTSTKKTSRKKTSKKAATHADKAEFVLPRKTAGQRERAGKIFKGLFKHYPDAHCELEYTTPHELLIATILSAQATDVAVNKATPALFKKFPTAAAYAKSTPQKIEPFVKSLGFFRNKAKAAHGASTAIVEEFGGDVPQTMEALLTLRGVARKTANVVLGNAFNINMGVVVDTHVQRISQRFNLTKHRDPKKIELDLMALFPREHWTMLSHLIIFHGRRSCKARGAGCSEHPLCQQYCSNA